MLDKYGHTRHDATSQGDKGMIEASLHGFRKSYCVPRADVLYRTDPFYSNEGGKGSAPMFANACCALSARLLMWKATSATARQTSNFDAE